MQLINNTTHIYGFEDYNIINLGEDCFVNTWGFHIPYCFEKNSGSYIVNKDLLVSMHTITDPKYYLISVVEFEPELATNHRELLNTAKNVFVHPSCKLSRSMLREKYKKSLNPFLSDAVIIPEPTYSEFFIRNYALFINDTTKVIVMIHISSEDAKKKLGEPALGSKFKDLVSCAPNDHYPYKPYKINDMMEAEFFYCGEVLYVPNSQSWAMDVLTHSIPPEKIVFENFIQESLGSEANQLSFDNLCSIMDMLNSSDEDTVSAGLKALSMMDWMHYSQSVKFILNNTKSKVNWIHNKACSSTSVKYMMKTISGDCARKRTWWPGDFDNEIYEEDFELFKKLKCHYHHVNPQDVMTHIRALDFISVDSNGLVIPNIKQRVA